MPDDKISKTSAGFKHAYKEDMQLLQDVAKDAGALALRYFNRDPQVWTKQNMSPVTEADLAVDQFLKETLMAARPDYGWLSEESEDNKDRLDKQRVFVIDPIDGTRAFIDGGTEWTISLAIVENHRPVAAVLFAPVRGEVYSASRFGGTYLNNVPVVCPRLASLDGARAAGPRPAIARGPLARAGVQNAGYVRSLAYRIVMVTTGALDLALAREDSNDWDLAAADLIVEEAHGVLRDKANNVLKYNLPNVHHDSLYASCKALGRLVAPIMPALQFPQRRSS
nr:3'(2'),5'-bisphosphate nucleotidase CysQ [uncultured Cohaesibacter sp.]